MQDEITRISPHNLDDLKRCPFCGNPAQMKTSHDPIQVGCFNPECLVRPKVSSTCENTAITRWNRRITITE